jgi:electron-transferring-flavoprotein dehydrogenase
MHGAGWPLAENGESGGWWMYHHENNQVSVGLITDLSYHNPYLSPFDEMQRFKHHPVIKQYLEGGKRVAYGARAIIKGGLNSLPKLTFPGGALLGDDAGFLNFSKIKGSHTAMKSGMLAAEALAELLKAGKANDEPTLFSDKFKDSWLFDELYMSRNFGPAMHRMGTFMGAAFNWIDQNMFPARFLTPSMTPRRITPHWIWRRRARRLNIRSQMARSASISFLRCLCRAPIMKKTSRSTCT